MVTAVVEQLDPELVGRLRRLKLRRIREVAGEVCLTARTQRWRPEELLRVLVEEECKARDEANRQARLKQAGFPVDKRLDGFQLSVSNLSQATFDYLASLEWLSQARNLALVGPPGTGKSHLAIALGRAAVNAATGSVSSAPTPSSSSSTEAWPTTAWAGSSTPSCAPSW